MNREDFKILETDLIYLDSAATTLKPNQVINKIKEYYEKYPGSAHRGDYSISYKASKEYESSRLKVAEFINAKPNEIVFTSGTTEGINLIVNNFFKNILKENDEIILSVSEHASNIVPWINLAKKLNLKLVYADLDSNYELTLKSIKNKITEKTKVISIAHMTNVIGDQRDIKNIAKLANENKIYTLIDGAQSIPHLKTDVKDLNIDFLVFSGHKMCAPTGIGVMYAKEELISKIEPFKLGGGMNETFMIDGTLKYKKPPTNLEGGTPNIEGAIALKEAIKYLDIEKNEIYIKELKEYLINKLSKIKHINILNKNTKGPILTFNVEGIFSQDVAFYLNKYNIALRAGNHCAKMLETKTNIKNTLRISLYFYNTKEEIDKLCFLLEDKNKIIKEMI